MVKETKLYDLLNVSPDASFAQLKKAYRTAALKFHPDKIGSSGESEEKKKEATRVFQEITTAYEILSDEKKRQTYDAYGEAGLKGVPDSSLSARFQQAESFVDQLFRSSSASDLDALFDSLAGGRPVGNSQRRMRKGRDILHTTYCTLADFYHGRTMKLSLTKKIKCPECAGRGGTQLVQCSACLGTGTIVNETRMGIVYQRVQTTCHQCNGSGMYIPEEYTCGTCHGNRLIDKKVILDVEIPKGVKPGYQVVFEHEADEGINIIPGDVVITLQEDKRRPTKNFQRRGNNLITSVTLSLAKALCGGLLKIEHLNKKIMKIYINRGDLANPNTIKVAKGYGMPIYTETDFGETRYGDLIIKFNIEFPKMNELSEVQYNMLNKALDPNYRPKNVSSSSSSEDVSVEDFSPLSGSTRTGSTTRSATASITGLKDPAEAAEEDSDESDIVYLTDFPGFEARSREWDAEQQSKRFKSG
ncbi:hypothetical protein KL949_002945 [Ogataea haglerorum]|nr:hypothetical protein KL913_002607 [Ogataea haglerorum]KAG7717973.1 hypothetical protein KL949_002945 [Ogataea haglerorum]KAG7771602.1 hypothetical protein KL931_001300 [Ogataea haglerorum]